MRVPRFIVIVLLSTWLGACADDAGINSPLSPVAAAFVNADVAMVAVEGLAQDVELMRGPGGAYGMGLPAERGRFECGSAARDGLTVTRSCVFKDAAGNRQSAYDSLTTASVSVNATVTGTVTRGPLTLTIDRTNDFTVSGLEGTETSATWNGGGRGTLARVRSTEDGTTRQYEMRYAVERHNVVIPVPRTAGGWPLSGTVTKRFTITISGGPNDGRTVTREVVITFDGTSRPTATVNGESWQIDLANRGRHRRP